MTLLYGTAMPILYFIAFLTYVIFYVTEKLCVFYYYKQPPNLDAKMTINTLDILRWAPFLNLAFSFWYLGNNQIFSNLLYVITYSTETTHSGHTMISELKHLQYDGSFAPFIMSVVFLIVFPFGGFLGRLFNFGRSFEVDENFGNYFEALEEEDKHWMVQEEENMTGNYRVKMTPEDIVRKLKQTKSRGRSVLGVHCYDIMANLEYASAFNYVPADVPNRDLMIQDDDEDEGNDAI